MCASLDIKSKKDILCDSVLDVGSQGGTCNSVGLEFSVMMLDSNTVEFSSKRYVVCVLLAYFGLKQKSIRDFSLELANVDG